MPISIGLESVQWDGESVYSSYDPNTRSWIFIAVHSSILGPATGGTRIMQYASKEAALADVTNLSRAMTYKFALAGFPRGGGKAVIALGKILDPTERENLLLHYGSMIQQLNGAFYTGPDVGSDSTDMVTIAQMAPDYVFARSVDKGGAGSSGPATAKGTYYAIKTTMEFLYGSADLTNRTIAIQGIGSVGKALAILLVQENASVYICDKNEAAVTALTKELPVIPINDNAIYSVPCDIFSPCALGGILSPTTIALLRCKAVVGAANNQLQDASMANALKKAGILYAPDFIVNAGGAVVITGIEALQWNEAQAELQLQKIGKTLKNVYSLAQEKNISTQSAAMHLAQQLLSA